MNADLLQGFYLGDFLVEPLKGEVAGPGDSRHLQPKAMEVLVCLARRPGELVTRETLLDEAWGVGKGSQEALGHAVSDIRHVLGDDASDPTFIQTLPKRGYRLVIAPEPVSGTGLATPPPVTEAGGRTQGWWQALLRHGVVQAAAAYLFAGWLLVQVADTTFDKIGLPAWSEEFATFVVIGGFPLLLLLAWCFEFVEGRIEEDHGEQPSGMFQGLERNYLAILIAYGVSAAGAGIYQATIGFDSGSPAPAPAPEALYEPVPVVENSLAVLKLATFDDDATTRAFSDGLSEDILDGLARLPGLYVSARGDAWSLPPHAPSELVRRRLRVASYLEGSVRFLGDKLRVIVQLIDSANGFHLFSRSFEIDIADVSTMQREVTGLVVANLKLAVDDASLGASSYASQSPDADAYLAYLLGAEALHRPQTIANLEEAIAAFDRALMIDAQYPAAHAGLCAAHTTLYQMREDPASIGLAEASCAQALAVAPRLPVVQRAAARLYYRTGRHAQAEALYLQALDVNAQDATAMKGLAAIRRHQQRFEEAESLLRDAIRLQPGNWASINTLGNMYFGMGRYTEAATEYRKVVYLDPDNFVTLGNLASTNLMNGNFEGARDALQRSLEIEENAVLIANLGIAQYYLGQFDAAVDALRRAVELTPQSAGNWIALADALSFTGDAQAAEAAYTRARDLAREQVGINARDVDSLTFLAWAAAMTGDLHQAAQLAQRAVDTDPVYPYAHYYDALIKLRSGDTSGALRAVAAALDNGYPTAMLAAEPLLAAIRDDARFVALLATHNNGGHEQ